MQNIKLSWVELFQIWMVWLVDKNIPVQKVLPENTCRCGWMKLMFEWFCTSTKQWQMVWNEWWYYQMILTLYMVLLHFGLLLPWTERMSDQSWNWRKDKVHSHSHAWKKARSSHILCSYESSYPCRMWCLILKLHRRSQLRFVLLYTVWEFEWRHTHVINMNRWSVPADSSKFGVH